MRKYAKIHEHMTSEHRLGRDVPLSEVSLPFCASVQAFSKKCGIFRALRCVLIGLAGLIRWCLRYQKMLIVFDSARWHKNSDYSKKALKLMRKYAKVHEHMTSEHRPPRGVPLLEVHFPFARIKSRDPHLTPSYEMKVEVPLPSKHQPLGPWVPIFGFLGRDFTVFIAFVLFGLLSPF